jgi:hypothetical protein
MVYFISAKRDIDLSNCRSLCFRFFAILPPAGYNTPHRMVASAVLVRISLLVSISLILLTMLTYHIVASFIFAFLPFSILVGSTPPQRSEAFTIALRELLLVYIRFTLIVKIDILTYHIVTGQVFNFYPLQYIFIPNRQWRPLSL